MNIKILRMSDSMVPPKFATDGSAGCDLYAAEDVEVEPGVPTTIPLGFGTEMPDDIHGRIESRSGMAIKGMVVLTGVIDSDYRGEWKVIIMNTNKSVTTKPFTVKVGDRIAQVVFRPTIKPTFELVESLTDTTRGAGGFGSTGSN